ERVLVARACRDKEQVGDRALYCLDAKSGNIQWRQPLKFNPWGGPSVSGKTVVAGGSSIGYDPAALRGAKGELDAFDLDSGKVRWRKDLKGGIVSSVALADGGAIATATDGKVRAYDLSDGGPRWIYDAKGAFFAPPAVARGVVYAADLGGVVHAIDLSGGTAKWVLDLGKAPEVMAPGMVYGGPGVQDGRLYVATCNLGGANAGQPTAVVCIGGKESANCGRARPHRREGIMFALRALIVVAVCSALVPCTVGGRGKDTGGVSVDKQKRTVTIDAKIAPRKLPHHKEVYPIEVIACWPHPKGKKA